MKTIKALKTTKEVEAGEIRRVDDKTAFNMVGNLWGYISKSEWKSATRKPKEEKEQSETTPKTRKKSK